jgi:quinoprotein glucose dehydrogenase
VLSFLLAAAGCRSPANDAASLPRADAYRTWSAYLGDAGRNQYSVLDQIDTTNVHRLEVAWTYRTGDAGERTQIQCNPLVIDGTLYGTSPKLKAFALNAATGAEQWRFDPFAGSEWSGRVNRGLAYWTDGAVRRLFYAAGPHLYALDAATGEPVATFGEGGAVDLRDGLDRDASNLSVTATSPGVVYEDLLIQGTSVGEGPAPAAPGHIRAYDVHTGEIAWTFHTIPRPGEVGYATWPEDAWQRVGGVNNWAGMSLDPDRGLVFIPLGSPAFDFWGGNRPGKNLFGTSLVALDAASGAYVWHFQFVHHDLWDRDPPMPPNLITVTHDGERIDAVAQATKSGHVFVLDRETGEALFPVEERPVPASDLEGEQAWPTQPVPTTPPPFARQTFTEGDITTRTPEAHASVEERFKSLRTGSFMPPSTEGTLIFPGFDGGGEWGGAAFDPETGLLYVNANEMPWILTMVETSPQFGEGLAAAGRSVYRTNCVACHGLNRQGDTQGAFPSLQNLSSHVSQTQARYIIRNGRGRMTGFPQLSERELDALIAFLFDTEAASGAAAPDMAATNDTPRIPYTHTGYNRFLDPDGYPAIEPPWGTLSAIDVNAGTIAWQVPLGEFEELTEQGIPQTGTENYGGPVVTAGGLIFIAATQDEMMRAFDKRTGDVLWEAPLPAGGYATPATYAVDGTQYVVIAAGGGKMGTKSGDTYVAYALP